MLQTKVVEEIYTFCASRTYSLVLWFLRNLKFCEHAINIMLFVHYRTYFE